MLFCIKTEISDLYFDWLSFLEICQTTLEWILGFLTEQGWVLNDDAPLAAAKILDEGSIVEKLAEEAKEEQSEEEPEAEEEEEEEMVDPKEKFEEGESLYFRQYPKSKVSSCIRK